MGWKPKEYYSSSPYEFFAACEGYFDKQDARERLVRLQTYYTSGGKWKNVKRPEDLWKIWSDKKQSVTKIMAEGDAWEQIKKTHNIK